MHRKTTTSVKQKVMTNFNVSPPRIAARKRPSGFNANLAC